MIFSSTLFLFYFLPLLLLFYFLSPTLKIKNIVLLLENMKKYFDNLLNNDYEDIPELEYLPELEQMDDFKKATRKTATKALMKRSSIRPGLPVSAVASRSMAPARAMLSLLMRYASASAARC